MKGVVPKIDHLLYLCNNFAYFGYNYLLVEFEDKFPFSNYQFMHHKAAYRKKELAKLNTSPCKVIPLLQCAGHLDYLLKHPQMRHLRKNNSIYQWNMAYEEVFTTWQNMADEILEIYPDCEYFHIGADEVEVFNDGDFEVFTKHVERCANYLIAKGKKVIIWDDMFRKHDIKTLQSLFKKVIIQVWQYREVDESIIAKMVNAGATVWGASRVQELESYNGLGFNNPIKNNIDQWIKINQKYNLEGHTGTFWGRVHSTYPLCAPLHQAIFMIAYLGNALTTNTMPNWEEFCQKMALFFGDETLNIDKIVFQSGYEPDKNKKLLHEVPQNNEIMEVVTLLNEYDSLINYIMACFKANWMMYNLYRNGDAPPKTTLNYLDGVRIIKERIQKLKDDIDSILGKYFHQAILDEFKSSRFDALLEINSQQEAELKNGSKLYQEKI
jgi:hypothetical protein